MVAVFERSTCGHIMYQESHRHSKSAQANTAMDGCMVAYSTKVARFLRSNRRIQDRQRDVGKHIWFKMQVAVCALGSIHDHEHVETRFSNAAAYE